MNCKCCCPVFAALLVGSVSSAHAAGNWSTNSLSKPVWLSEVSLGIKESYDNNVFLSDVAAKYLPASYVVPPGSVAALRDEGSWLTTISPKIGVNFAPLLGTQNPLRTLSLAYAPDFVVFHDQASENYNAHRLLTAINGQTESVSFNVDNSFIFIDGSDLGPVYPNSLFSAFVVSSVRERREQIQERGNVSVQIDAGQWFVRPLASLLYFDYLTRQLDPASFPGYQNYVDRLDVHGGADFGYKITTNLALTVGYRVGEQYQQTFAFSPYNSTDDYQRLLFGLEGKPWNWLEVKIQGGPDFRNYAASAPLADQQPVKYYGEAMLTATFTHADLVTFKCKQWQWLSCFGKAPYYESICDLNYHHQWNRKLGWDLGGRLMSWDFTSGTLTTCHRKDLEYTVATGLDLAVNTHLVVSLSYTVDWGRNDLADVVNPATREFDHQLVSLAAKWKF